MPKIGLFIGIILLGVAFAAFDLVRQPAFTTLPPIQEKATPAPYPAPNFTFTDFNGVTRDLKSLKGKTVFINFWATWCPPCVFEMPQMIALAKREPDNFALIAMSVDQDPETVSAFFDRISPEPLPDNFIVSMDRDMAVSKDLFDTTVYPETYVVNPKGFIIKKIAGIEEWLSPHVSTLIHHQEQKMEP